MHSERATGNPATPDFIPPGFTTTDVTYHNVITEWRVTNPAANTFEGTRRELLRIAHVVANLTHPFGHVEFNPTSKPGAPDYGLLYTSGSDTGFSNGGGPNANNPGQTQRLDTLIGAILRIDPRSPAVSGGMKGLGDYTIPAVNTFAADGDPKTFGRLFVADVAAMKKADDGMPQTVAAVEEIQLYVRGANGNRTYVTLRELVERTMGATVTRADLHISRSRA